MKLFPSTSNTTYRYSVGVVLLVCATFTMVAFLYRDSSLLPDTIPEAVHLEGPFDFASDKEAIPERFRRFPKTTESVL